MEPQEQHYLVGLPFQPQCVCGWEARLGTLALREFDRHLIAVRAEES